jgi:muramoyltetrapeptide carboxypeptidase LdcA involved in peptidoglycan recycling
MIDGATDGVLMGGNLGTIGRAVGWACPSFAGAILLIEAVDVFIGQIDGTLTQLRRSSCLDGLRGVAVGQFIRSVEPKPGSRQVLAQLLNPVDRAISEKFSRLSQVRHTPRIQSHEPGTAEISGHGIVR